MIHFLKKDIYFDYYIGKIKIVYLIKYKYNFDNLIKQEKINSEKPLEFKFKNNKLFIDQLSTFNNNITRFFMLLFGKSNINWEDIKWNKDRMFIKFC